MHSKNSFCFFQLFPSARHWLYTWRREAHHARLHALLACAEDGKDQMPGDVVTQPGQGSVVAGPIDHRRPVDRDVELRFVDTILPFDHREDGWRPMPRESPSRAEHNGTTDSADPTGFDQSSHMSNRRDAHHRSRCSRCRDRTRRRCRRSGRCSRDGTCRRTGAEEATDWVGCRPGPG